MATTAERLQGPDLLRSYLRALARHGAPQGRDLGRGRQLRTCARCGERSVFHPDPEGGWYVCGACGRYA